MTDQRALKKHIRERMARTGESYTTARRHVIRPAGQPLPSGLVAGYDTFGPDEHRLSSLAVHLLHQAGVELSEPMVCGLAGGVGFMYAIFEYRGVPPIVTIVAQHHPDPWVQSALQRLRIPYSDEHSSVTARALAALRGALEQGRPVYASVDRSRLPWHNVPPAYAIDPYGVVVAGIDGESLLVDDGAATPHTIPIDAFGAAWASHKKSRHHRLVLDSPPQLDLPAAIRAAIAVTVAHFTGPVLGNSFDSNFGFSGMAKFADQLRDARTKAGWQRRFDSAESVSGVLRRLYECLEIEYTAPAATRPLYAAFLDEAAALLGSPALTEAAALFRESAGCWSAVAATASEHAGAYGELCERRLLLTLCRLDVTEVDAEIAALPPGPDLGTAGRAAVFAELADRVDAARLFEQRAVATLAG